MKLLQVQDYVTESRVLLQDEVPPYRYDDDGLVTALNTAMYEITRIRPDILTDLKYRSCLPKCAPLEENIPETFTLGDMQRIVPVPPAYKMATIYYICGNAQLRDVEDTTDQRAVEFMKKFNAAMITLQG